MDDAAFVLSGSGILSYLGEKYTLSPGDCAFVNCKNDYYHESSDDLWTIRWIHFYGPTASGIYSKYIERGGEIIFHPYNTEKFAECWEKIFELASSDDYIRDMKINEQLSSLCCLLMAESWHSESRFVTDGRQSMFEVQEYLKNHLSEKITLDRLSEHFFVNKYYLTRLFKNEYGLTINEYLLQIRISHAKELLRFSSLSIEEISESCGIAPLYYFSRVFKKVEGINPREYRKKWR